MLPDPANRISHAAVWYWMVRYLAGVVLIAAVAVTGTVLLPLAGARGTVLAIVIVVLLVLIALAVVVPLWRYAVHRWEATNAFVITRSGAVFRDWRIVPLHRVQTVEVSQGILERAFGIARLVIRTASYAGSTEIAGLNVVLARQVADHLTAALAGHADDGA